ncbi:UDP-glucose 4-epimerase GalE [Avrilella dinanensis]|uniref:UDP-glucose 4-epimerase n=1 Tax=Avrilella dinanensis TaxID=2008672 RepID=A0A2M9R4W8_9FLAO|nr:UDP-glucose 4-epimerase GalE [Avrilella dinanensis]PJR03872.1 UDP-glucose 4-epimerase GalE [Avrilella dinanensis]
MGKILVTGGLGYIGSHTVVVLQEAGYEVVIVDDLSNSDISFLERITEITGRKPEFYQLDLKDYDKVLILFKEKRIDGVIHFAAHKAVGESVVKPLMYYRNNMLGLINLLEVMEVCGVDHMIFSSSCTVYGQAEKMPIDEQTPLKQPESPYGKTKQMGEEIIADYVKATQKNAIALRYFNPVGAHPTGLLGEVPNGIPNNLLPYITQVAAGIREKLNVFGADYETRDGTAIRDYIDVNDLADAHVKALNRLIHKQNKKFLEFFNLGTGIGSTVLEMIHAFEKANGLKIPYEIINRREGDIQEAYANFTLAKKELEWEPTLSLEQSLQNSWEFQKKI